ncbi:Pycsar system effector family protein [Nocardia sp. NPDC052112]|uniref:Pycsar system effector family protein n=1 Tax=Nocardia sp. NPDC052112 TaxID=3155646 RepID=UPI00341BCFE6
MLTVDSWRALRRWANGDREVVENTWRTLELTLAQVKHAETKAITTLATTGVLGQMLFNLVRAEARTASVAVSVGAGACAVFILSACVASICVLWPRVRSSERSKSLFHFSRAADPDLTPDTYMRALTTLSHHPDNIVEQLAAQIMANAGVAQRKYRFANIAVSSLLAAVVVLATTGCVFVLQDV